MISIFYLNNVTKVSTMECQESDKCHIAEIILKKELNNSNFRLDFISRSLNTLSVRYQWAIKY